jgi:hypothetical protein
MLVVTSKSPTMKTDKKMADMIHPHTWGSLHEELEQANLQFSTNSYPNESPTSFMNADSVLIIAPTSPDGTFAKNDLDKLTQIYADHTIFAAFSADYTPNHQHMFKYNIEDEGYLQAAVAATLHAKRGILVYVVGHGTGGLVTRQDKTYLPWLIHYGKENQTTEVHLTKVIRCLANLCKVTQPPINTLVIDGQDVFSKRPAVSRNSTFAPCITVMANFEGASYFHDNPCQIQYLLETAKTLEMGKNIVHKELVQSPADEKKNIIAVAVQAQVVETAKHVIGVTQTSASSIFTSMVSSICDLNCNWPSVVLTSLVCVYLVLASVYDMDEMRDPLSYYAGMCFVSLVINCLAWKYRTLAMIMVTCFFTGTIAFGKMSNKCGGLLKETFHHVGSLTNTSLELKNYTELQFGSLVHVALHEECKNVHVQFRNQSYVYIPIQDDKQCMFGDIVFDNNKGLTTTLENEVMFTTCTHSVFQNAWMQKKDMMHLIDSIQIDTHKYSFANTRNAVYKLNAVIGNDTEQEKQMENINKMVSNINRPSLFKVAMVGVDQVVLGCKEFAKYFKKIVEGR